MVCGIFFLIKKSIIWDHRGLAFAEIGTIFMFLVLTTGPIWAKPAWGHYWPWEPRLTTSLILFLIFLGYFMLREFGGNPEQVSRFAAVVGILAFLDVPLIFLSVKFWLPEMQSHPQVGQYFDSASPTPTYLVLYSFLSLLVIASLMIRFRINILTMKDEE
jgi:heme exporter protein C